MASWIAIISLAVATVVGIGSALFFGNDNAIEEVCEEIIEDITGIEDIDMSPGEDEEIEDGK